MNFLELKNQMMKCGASFLAFQSQGIGRQEALKRSADWFLFNSNMLPTLRLAPSFAAAWAESAFAVLQPSHRLAASLQMTKIPPDIAGDIKTPFRCFAISVPSGITSGGGLYFVLKGRNENFLRALTFDYENDEWISCYDDEKDLSAYAEREVFWEDNNVDRPWEIESRRVLLRGRLIVGCCLEMQTLPSQHSRGLSQSYRTKRGEPRTTVFTLGRPIKHDVRTSVSDFLHTGRCSYPSVQTLVRGHWKMQPHGLAGACRKFIHIEPYWRGPEEAPIIVRPHDIGSK